MSRLLIFCRETCQTGAVIGASAEPQTSSPLRSNLREIRFRFSEGQLQSCFVNDESGDPFLWPAGRSPVVKLFRRLPPTNEITDAVCEHEIIASRGPSGTLILQNQPSKTKRRYQHLP